MTKTVPERIGLFLNRVVWKSKYNFSKAAIKIFKVKPKVECNICGWLDFNFYSDKWHPYTICPNCSSQVRQRLFWAILNKHNKYNKEKIIRDKTVLHFSPEGQLRYSIKGLTKNYKTADFFAEGYYYDNIDYNTDITDMRIIEDNTFDSVIAFDVLEHLSNDKKALEEIKRILKPGGIAILTVPMKDNLKITYEDSSIVDPKEREQVYGQFDHFRIYGEDFFDRVSKVGLEVEIVDHTLFDDATLKRYVLFPPVLSSNPLATNYRKIYFGTKQNNPTPNF
ncbi:MAG TPA: class I SAM-dependent methyltransferase [Chitinophagaceae bacterium]|nr:class I SAM-dependent methyltransferase [Chitinophagaceae bacterium]